MIPLGAVILSLFLLGLALGHLDIIDMTPQGIEGVVRSAGRTAPILFLVLSAFRGLFFVPVGSFTVAAGLIFGPIYGFAWGLMSVWVSTLLPFTIGRKLGRVHVQELLDRTDSSALNAAEQLLSRRGFLGIMLLRFMPFPPFDSITYLSGVSAVRPMTFWGGSMLGSLPGIIVWTYLGSHLSNPRSPQFLLAVILVLLTTGIGYLLIRRLLLQPAE